jgi:type IV pilus assembly protein PilA
MSNLIRKSKKGFTLIELMIVVAIIGILAAIAIPNFLRFQLKSKSSEGKVNIAAIRTAEESYLAEFGEYVGVATPVPALIPGTSKAAFTPAGNFDTLGWSPEGQVFFNYAVAYASATPSAYTITAAADIDGDTVNQVWGYVKPVTGTNAGIVPVGAHGVCTAAGIAGSQLSTVGPCASTHGQSIF